MTPEESIIKEVRLLCEQVSEESITESAPIISRCGSLLISHPLLIPISNDMWEAEVKEYTHLNATIKKISRKVTSLCIALSKCIARLNITNPDIIKELGVLKYRELQNSAVLILQLIAIKRILHALLSCNKSPDLIKLYDEANKICLDELQQASFNLNRLKRTQDWYVFREVIDFHILYDPRLYEQQKDNLKKKHPINAIRLTAQYDALERAIGVSNIPHAREEGFNPRHYKRCIQRICLLVEKRLMSTASAEPRIRAERIRADWNYNSKTGAFHSSTGRHQFRAYRIPEDKKKSGKKSRDGYGYSRPILDHITKDTKSQKTKWSSSSLCNSINYHGSEEEGRRAVYDTCKHINTTILKKCGLKDFLIFDMYSVCINPEYLNS